MPTINAYIGFFILQFPKSLRLTKELIQELTTLIYTAAKLKPLGEVVTRKLPSPIDDYPSYCTVQPLMTSVIAVDAWPEYDTMVVTLHSCQTFSITQVANIIIRQYPEAKILKIDFIDLSLKEKAEKHFTREPYQDD